MNSKERMALAMYRKRADRVPVMCQMALGHYFLFSGISPERIWFTSEGFVEALITMRDRYRFDGILANLWGMPSDLLDHVSKITETPDGKQLLWENGETSILPPDDNAQHYGPGRKELERADFDTIPLSGLDSIHEYGGYFWNIYHRPYLADIYGQFKPGEIPEYFARPIELLMDQVGDEFSIHGEIYSPFTHFIELFGYEQALMSLLTDAKKTHRILSYLTEVAISHAQAITDLSVDAILISSAFAGGPFLSRDMYQDFVVPYERRVTDAVKARDTIVYTHTCGHIGDRLDLMIETGTMGIDTLDPPPLGNSDLKTALEEIDGRVFVKGNMNPVEFLNFTSEEEVIAHAKNRITTGGPGGGYILSTACSVAPKTAPWKLEMLTRLAEEFGRYPMENDPQ